MNTPMLVSSARCARRPGVATAWMVLVPVIFGVMVVDLSAATVRTTNFAVSAPTEAIARQVAQRAERERRSIAELWLGRVLPDWNQPCQVKVRITGGEAGGVTTFRFAIRGGMTGQKMTVEGRLDRILESALPHEVTHTIFATVFGGPLPRWADEGASLLSEDHRELVRHEQIALRGLRSGKTMPLATLFTTEEYPRDIMSFYGQGYSVTRFLIEIGGQHGRLRFLHFLKSGMEKDWNRAVNRYYGFADTRDLDRAWRAWHRTRLARANSGRSTDVAGRSTPITVRAQSPSDRSESKRTVPSDDRTTLRTPIRSRSSSMADPDHARLLGHGHDHLHDESGSTSQGSSAPRTPIRGVPQDRRVLRR